MILKNAHVLYNDKIDKLDIKIENEKIIKIDSNIEAEKNEIVLDYKDKYIIAGGIDPHTHFNIFTNTQSSDDFHSGSIAALHGGTTTVIDHPGFGPKDCALNHQINKYHEYAKQSLCDYALHGVVQHINQNTFDEMKSLKQSGINSFKMYLTYLYMLEDSDVIKLLNYAKELDIVICVHAENHFGIEYLKKIYKERTDLLEPLKHALSRANIFESEAVYRLLSFCEAIKFDKLYLVHMSAKESFDVIRLFKDRGLKFYTETCIQYLFLDDCVYLEDDGYKYILSPPLRKKGNEKYIYQAIKDGFVDTIATDHCTFLLEQKSIGKTDFSKCPNGTPGVEERIALLFTEFLKGTFTAKEFVDLSSKNAASIFQLKNKGCIDKGIDADIIVIEKGKYYFDKIHSLCGYTCYDKIELQAKITDVFLRGEHVIKDGQCINKKQGIYVNNID